MFTSVIISARSLEGTRQQLDLANSRIEYVASQAKILYDQVTSLKREGECRAQVQSDLSATIGQAFVQSQKGLEDPNDVLVRIKQAADASEEAIRRCRIQ